MPARALLVLLVMLNLGVATWWLLRPAPPGPTAPEQSLDVPRLRILGEPAPAPAGRAPEAGTAAAPDGPGDRASAAERHGPAGATGVAGQDLPPGGPPGAVEQATAPVPAAATAPLLCMSFGPFDDAVSVAAARTALQPLGAERMRLRDVVDAPRGWRVVMPPQPDRAAADALAAKIRDAGFDDLLVVPSGDEANGIALGRYASESSARRRESALRTAGFPAQAQPLGDVVVRHWLDVAAGAGFDASAARAATAAAQARDIECTGIVAAGGAR